MSKTRILSFVAFYLLLATLAIAYVSVQFCGSNANNIISAITAPTPSACDWPSRVTDLLKGKEFFIYTNPLEPFLEQNPQCAAEAGTEEQLQLAGIRSYL